MSVSIDILGCILYKASKNENYEVYAVKNHGIDYRYKISEG